MLANAKEPKRLCKQFAIIGTFILLSVASEYSQYMHSQKVIENLNLLNTC